MLSYAKLRTHGTRQPDTRATLRYAHRRYTKATLLQARLRPSQSQRHSATQRTTSPPITTAQRHPDHALPSKHNGTVPPRPRITQTTLSPLNTTARCHPDHALPTNHNGAATPTPRSPHQTQRHNDTHTMLSLPITTAQRYPDHALPTKHNGTATPRSRSPHQTQTAQRHPHHALPANHQGTASPRPRSPRESQWHSASDTTRPAPIPTAQRHKAPPRQPPSRPILTAKRIGHIAVVREPARTWTFAFPNSKQTRSCPQTPQTKTRTIRYAFGKKNTHTHTYYMFKRSGPPIERSVLIQLQNPNWGPQGRKAPLQN